MPRRFSARDRRALSVVLTAGLKHAHLDELTAAHPIPGDPGHDAGKAGRVALFTATVLAGTDHTPLVQALELIEPPKIPPAHQEALARLRKKASLPPTPQSTPEGAPEPAPEEPPQVAVEDLSAPLSAAGTAAAQEPAEAARVPGQREQPAAGDAEPSPRHVPTVWVRGLAEDHPVVQVLLAAGIVVAHHDHAGPPPADALELHPVRKD